MTIAAGFRCKDGVILCADSEITLSQGKTYQSKLYIINRDQDCCLAYAGDVNFAKELVDIMRNATKGQEGKNLVDIARNIYRSFYRKHYTEQPKAEKTWATILMTVRDGRAISLFCAEGTHWFKVEEYQLLGVAREQGEAVFKAFYSKTFTNLEVGYMAIYGLRRIKGFVQGCGGHTELAEIKASTPASARLWNSDAVKQTEDDFDYFDQEVRPLILAFPNLGIGNPEFRVLLRSTSKRLLEQRRERLKKKAREEWKSIPAAIRQLLR
jgi:Proteasome subunit